MSETEIITVVVGRFTPITGLESADLERIVTRHAPQVPIPDGKANYELLFRLKISATEAGIAVDRPLGLSATMLLVAKATSPTATSEVGLLTAVHLAARSESAPCVDDVVRVALVLPGERPLTRRETQVLEHLSRGRSDRQIANALHISTSTVTTHVARIFRKLGVRKRQQLVGMRVPVWKN